MIGRARALGWSLAFLAGGFALGVVLLQLVPLLPSPAGTTGALWGVLIQSLVLVVAFGLFTWAIGARALRLSAEDFGARPVRRGRAGFGRGWLIGVVLAGVAMAIAVAIGRADWRADGGSVTSWMLTVVATGAVLLPAALAEELMFRGVPMIALSRAFGRLPAIVGLSLLFALGHLWNPEISALALANIAIAGVFLGFAFFTPGGLWTATGAHLGWNVGLAALAAPVSGWPLPMPGIDYLAREPHWLTGGGFGPEGGVLAALCLLGGVVITARRATREGTT